MVTLAIGEKCPDFLLADTAGQQVRLSDFAGQVVFLNFWSAECPWAARADFAFAEAYRREGWQGKVAWLSIAANGNESLDLVRRVALERELPLVLFDENHRVADEYGAETTPHCFVLDAEGRLRYRGGFDDQTFRQRVATRSYALEAVRALLANQPVQVSEAPSFGCTIVRFAEK